MKKLALIVVMLVTVGAFAQKRGNGKGDHKGDAFTPEQKVQLMVMKLSIALDLSEKQEAQITPIVAKKVDKMTEMKEHRKDGRNARKELSNDEKFKVAMDRLEEQKSLQNKMKKILDKDQYVQWKKMHKKQMKQRKKGFGKGKGRGQGKGHQAPPREEF